MARSLHSLTGMHRDRADPNGVFEIMHAQHMRIETSLRQMEDLVTGDDREAMCACWAKLEDCVLTHLNLEEMHFLPRIATKDPAHAREIRSEHDVIRERLGEIGLALDLHTARADQIAALAALLRSHAELEEKGLYSMAERELTADTSRSILKRIRALISD
jgi:hypothetical protein